MRHYWDVADKHRLLEEYLECFAVQMTKSMIHRRQSLLVQQIFPNVLSWVNRKHGQFNFHLTQLLYENGCFKTFSHGFGFAESVQCSECMGVLEPAEYVMFAGPRFDVERHYMPIIERMCWEKVT